MSEILLPCPFCGCQSVFNRIPAVYCADCGAQGKYTDDPEYRAKAWNTRVGVAPRSLHCGEPPLTCPAIDAFIRDRSPSDAVVHDLENIRGANSQLRYSMWGWKERSDELQAALDGLNASLSDEANEPEDGAEIIFLGRGGEQHRITYHIAEDVPGLGSGWIYDESFSDPLFAAPQSTATNAPLAVSGAAMIDAMTPEQIDSWQDHGNCNAGKVAPTPSAASTDETATRAAAIEECAAYIDEVASFYPADGGSKSLLVMMAKEVRSLVTVPVVPTTSPEPPFDLAAFQKEAATWKDVENEQKVHHINGPFASPMTSPSKVEVSPEPDAVEALKLAARDVLHYGWEWRPTMHPRNRRLRKMADALAGLAQPRNDRGGSES